LFLTGAIYQAMVGHARSAAPNEACGIVAGMKEKVLKFYPASNREASPTHYLLEPAEQFEIFREVEERGWGLLGIFHSHPEASAFPSQQDIEMAYYPDLIHLIVSLRKGPPELRGFWIRGGKVVEEEIQIGPETEGENSTCDNPKRVADHKALLRKDRLAMTDCN